MPIYEYQCAACGRVTEKWQKFSEPPLTVCPACGGDLNKLISSCSFHLKGSGWYVTDYGGNRAGAAAAEKPGEAKVAGSSDETPQPKETGKTDTAPPPKLK
jgi:putative FmdB family regulatory protein